MADRIGNPTPGPSPEARAAQQTAAADRYLDLAARDATTLTPAEFNALQHAARTLNHEVGNR
ncbi:hypothetical protein [Streptomyces sp. NPDC085596]|uniref:hypothetical protein n=1 Tax=Streptomyces sp. NPDC085596 TaxID=3365731 RepID=UPI0037D63F8C